MKNVGIIYYTGTGGTGMAADCLADTLMRHNHHVDIQRLIAGKSPTMGDIDRLIVMFPVYAFNAPQLIPDWMKGLPSGQGKRAAVISVSGGGEMRPNTACRNKTIKILEKKGFVVDYENMLVMPSNIGVAIKAPLDKMLLDILPQKVEEIADALEHGATRRKKPYLGDRILATLGVCERIGGHYFGKRIRVGETCNGCGHCSKNCPSGNITMKDDKPLFAKSCHFCMNCLYSCPMKALTPGVLKTAMLKNGYDLNALAEKPKQDTLTQEQIKELAPGAAWVAVREYLTSNR